MMMSCFGIVIKVGQSESTPQRNVNLKTLAAAFALGRVIE